MKNTSKLFGIIVFMIIIGFSMVSCDNGDLIPIRWQGTYENVYGDAISILPTGDIVWAQWNFSSRPNGSMSGVAIVSGGTISAPGVTGEWVYSSLILQTP